MTHTELPEPTIGWIDFSKAHRTRVFNVLDMLEPDGMIDELGLGTLRDGLANEMFPGISTIQTRARYFFIIPYLLHEYQQLTAAKRKGKKAHIYFEDQEYEIMWDLAEAYNHEKRNGIIGISKRRAKKEKIARRPSAIYWYGLNFFKFIDSRGLSAEAILRNASQPDYLEMLSLDQQEGDDMPKEDWGYYKDDLFRIRVPYKKDWHAEKTIELYNDEAEILRDKILSRVPDKLIGKLLTGDALWNLFSGTKNFKQFAKAAVKINSDSKLKKTITLAHDFSELMYGAQILYNQILQKEIFKEDFKVEEFEEWKKQLSNEMIDFDGFQPNDITLLAPTSKPHTKFFLTEWWKEAQTGFNNYSRIKWLIQSQEANAKGNKARMNGNNTEGLKEGKWIGLTQFNYRFVQANNILHDILSKL